MAMEVCVCEIKDRQTDRSMDGWMAMDGWMDGRTDGRTDGWKDYL